ncbi:hypothetical protein P692DRAFT_20738069, partial [Suillus brevipes Sb2]
AQRSQYPAERRRSASPNKSASVPARDARTSSRRAGFQDGAHRQQSPAVCAVCLGSHTHSFIECTAERLWNKSHATSATRVNKQLLLRSSNQPLCLDWQRSRGCSTRTHDERHVCTGCLSTTHGSQHCSRAQKVTSDHTL